MSHRNPDARQPPATTISVFEDYVKHLQQEKQTMEIQQQQLKKLLLYEKWRIQEQKQTDKLHRDAERVALQNTLLRNRHESLENEKKMQTEKLNRALYQNVEMTPWPSTNNQFRVPSDYQVNSSIQIQNLKKQVADIKSTNEALRESIDKLQKELENIQTPGKKRSLEDLDRMIMSIRESNKALKLKIQHTQINNTWFENQNQQLQSDIELCRQKTKVLEEQNKTLQQRKDFQSHAGQNTPTERKTTENEAKLRQFIRDVQDFTEPPCTKDWALWKQWALKTLGYPVLNEKDIQKAYRKLALVFHPDKIDNVSTNDETISLKLQEPIKLLHKARDFLLAYIKGYPFPNTCLRFEVSLFTSSGLSAVTTKHAQNRYTVKQKNEHLSLSDKVIY